MSEVISGVLDRIDTRVRGIEAAIPPMVQALTVIGSKVQVIDHQVDSLLARQGETQQFLVSFYGEFHGYLEDYRRRTELQLAETRIVKVRQELEHRFGHYAEVRRRVTGILQATDIAIVRAETVRTTAEEMMLGAPRYWLAPGLVALMAWIVGERDIADRALAEALRRDPYKTDLFLTLICRRAGRMEAMSRWLELYLRLLDPQAIDREVVVVLDAVATGTLGRKAQDVFWQASLGWIEALRQVPGQVEEQARRWMEVLDAERGRVEPDEFQLLRTHSPAWPALAAALADVRRNPRVVERFRKVVETPTHLPPSVLSAVDGLLDTMVGRFDDEELPLRRQERLLQLILDEEGDRQKAEARMAVEEDALAEKVSFVARLTDILMYPEQAGASLAAQRYAAAFSRDWILAAHQALVRRDDEQVPKEIEIRIGDWQGTSRDGHNGQELAGSVRSSYEVRKARESAAIKLPVYAWLTPAVGLAFTALALAGGVSLGFSLAVLAIGGLLFLFGRRTQAKRREELAAKLDRELGESLQILESVLAELASYRRNWTIAHTAALDVDQILRSISLADTLYQGPQDEPAALLRESTGGGSASGRDGAVLAETLAVWDLVPPPSVVQGSVPAL
ncbi:MAG: hypothetical protein QOE95_1862 [Gaiellaceae bacterium]|jgi:hypothetical protein|nr:hypothetical protein [Gaiellaceae bacterium]